MEIAQALELIQTAGNEHPGPIVWLTGAGISAESGIPTFRGAQGYWRVGSRNYHPQELATFAAYTQMPNEVWSWYLYRRSVCRAAAANPAHHALAALESEAPDRFLLVTQNVDGLHLRAGNTLARTYQVHGNIDYMRKVSGSAPVPLPEALGETWARERSLTEAEFELLRHEGEPTRPHVLWFDETYDEINFRFDSTLRAADEAALLIVVGSTGQTNLPVQLARRVLARDRPMIVIDPEVDENAFAQMNEAVCGAHRTLRGGAGTFVPALADAVASLSPR